MEVTIKLNLNYYSMKTIIFSITFFFALNVSGQIDSVALQTPEGITSKMLEFISCEKGEVKDWNEYRNLFLPLAQKISINDRKEGPSRVRVLNLEEFVRYFSPQYSKYGFNEIVIGLDVNEFNGIANVFQSFHCKTPDGSYEARGVNSFQLVYNENRWWIASTMFTNESKDNPLTNELLFEEYRQN